MTAEARWAAIEDRPQRLTPAGRYRSWRLHANVLWLAGHGPTGPTGPVFTGTVGKDLALDGAIDAARLTALNLLTTVREAVGSLDRVEAVLDVFGLVRCTPEFTEHPRVIDGFSEVLLDVLGEQVGSGPRAAVGCTSLPFGIPVEITARLAVR